MVMVNVKKEKTCMSSYAEERIAARRAINAQSKRRAREMERRVAKFLGGHRVPMSGAGAIKGDCEVFTDAIGRVFIECKYSAGIHPSYGPTFHLQMKWFPKLEQDAEIMRARIAALVFRYHDKRLSDYVIIRTDVLLKYVPLFNLATSTVLDYSGKKVVAIYKKHLDAAFAVNPESVIMRSDYGDYAIILLETFKDIIHGTYHQDIGGISGDIQSHSISDEVL